MPQPVAELEKPYPVLGRHDVAVSVEVGEIGDAGAEPLRLLAPDMAGRGIILQFAEMLGEGDLLGIAQILAAEHQHGVAVHPRFDRRHRVRSERPPAIDAGNLAGKIPSRRQRADRYRHSASVSKKAVIAAQARMTML